MVWEVWGSEKVVGKYCERLKNFRMNLNIPEELEYIKKNWKIIQRIEIALKRLQNHRKVWKTVERIGVPQRRIQSSRRYWRNLKIIGEHWKTPLRIGKL